MGRKIEFKKIEDIKRLQVTFSKRRASLIKKIREVSISCDVDVAFLAFSSAGRISKFSNRERIEDLLDRYVNLPVEKRLCHMKNIQDKLKRAQELCKITNEEGCLYYLRKQIENLEIQAKLTEIEVQHIEANLRDFELNSEQDVSIHLLSCCEAKLKHAIEKVKEKKEETVAMEKEQGISWLYNDNANRLLHTGSSLSNGQNQMRFDFWRNMEFVVPKNLFNVMLGNDKEKGAGDWGAVGTTTLQPIVPMNYLVRRPQVDANSSSLAYFISESSNIVTHDFLSALNEKSMLQNEPKLDLNNTIVDQVDEETANNSIKENLDTNAMVVSPPSSVLVPLSTSKVSIQLHDFFPTK